LEWLLKLPKLTKLTVDGTVDKSIYKPLESFTRLTSLSCYIFKKYGIAALKCLNHLEELTCEYQTTDETVKYLPNFWNCLTSLTKLTKLSLELTERDMEVITITPLMEMTRLTYLHFEYGACSAPLDEKTFSFSSLVNLRELYFYGSLKYKTMFHNLLHFHTKLECFALELLNEFNVLMPAIRHLTYLCVPQISHLLGYAHSLGNLKALRTCMLNCIISPNLSLTFWQILCQQGV
jgi:hypothetical protein